MIIEVYSKKDSNNYRIYKDVDDILDSSDGESFFVYKFDTLFHDFDYIVINGIKFKREK